MRPRKLEIRWLVCLVFGLLVGFDTPAWPGEPAPEPGDVLGGFEFPNPGMIRAVWIDGVATDLDTEGRLPMAPGTRRLAVVTSGGRIYATKLTVVSAAKGLSVVNNSYQGPDVQRTQVKSIPFGLESDSLFIHGDYLIFREGDRLLIYDAYDLRLLRTIPASQLAVPLFEFAGGVHSLERISVSGLP